MFHVRYLTHYKSDSRRHTPRGEKPREQLGFRADTNRGTVRVSLACESRASSPSTSAAQILVQVYKKQAVKSIEENFLSCPCWEPQHPRLTKGFDLPSHQNWMDCQLWPFLDVKEPFLVRLTSLWLPPKHSTHLNQNVRAKICIYMVTE